MLMVSVISVVVHYRSINIVKQANEEVRSCFVYGLYMSMDTTFEHIIPDYTVMEQSLVMCFRFY